MLSRTVPILVSVLLVAGCGGDDDDQAASPPPPTTTVEAPATTPAPAATQPPTETTPAPEPGGETTPEPKADGAAATPAPQEKAPADAGSEKGLDGAADAAAASLQAQISGDYAAVKRLVSKQCGKQVTKASVDQMKAAFDALSKQAAGKKLNEIVEGLSRPEGWKVTAAGGGEAKVTAAEEAGFADYYFIREDGVWKDNTCVHDGSAENS